MNLSEALAIFDDNLTEIKDTLIAALEEDVKAFKKRPHNDNALENELRLELDRLELEQMTKPRLLTIKRILGRQQHTGRTGITDEMIETAKAHPIEDIHQLLVNTPIRGGMTTCPFHPDKTASLSFRRFNRYRCFGCDAKGSVIDYYMHLNQTNFINAVKALQ